MADGPFSPSSNRLMSRTSSTDSYMCSIWKASQILDEIELVTDGCVSERICGDEIKGKETTSRSKRASEQASQTWVLCLPLFVRSSLLLFLCKKMDNPSTLGFITETKPKLEKRLHS